MAKTNLDTLYFGLGLNTEQFEKDLKKAREIVAKMEIKAELNLEIPEISIDVFQKKIKALNAQIDKITKRRDTRGLGLEATARLDADITAMKNQVSQYETYIKRLQNVNVKAGDSSNLGLTISGDDKVLDTIQKVRSELSKLEQGVDIKLNIGGEGGSADPANLERLSKRIEDVKSKIQELKKAQEEALTNFGNKRINLDAANNALTAEQGKNPIRDYVASQIKEAEIYISQHKNKFSSGYFSLLDAFAEQTKGVKINSAKSRWIVDYLKDYAFDEGELNSEIERIKQVIKNAKRDIENELANPSLGQGTRPDHEIIDSNKNLISMYEWQLSQLEAVSKLYKEGGRGSVDALEKEYHKAYEEYKSAHQRASDVDAELKESTKKLEAAQAEYNAELAKGDGLINSLQAELKQLANMDMRLNLVGDEEVLRRLKEIEAVKNGLAELSTVKIDIKTQENTFSKAEVDKQISDAVAAKVTELEKKYQDLANAKEKASKAGSTKKAEEDPAKNLANLEKQLQRIKTFEEKMGVRMENIGDGEFSDKAFNRLQSLMNEYQTLAASDGLTAQQVKDFQARVTAETQIINALISAQQKYNQEQRRLYNEQKREQEKEEREYLRELDKQSKATQKTQLSELDVKGMLDKNAEKELNKYLSAVRKLNEEIRELDNLEAKMRHEQLIGNISQDQLDAIISKLRQYRDELERLSNLEIGELTDDMLYDNTGQGFRGRVQDLNRSLSDAVRAQRQLNQETREGRRAIQGQSDEAKELGGIFKNQIGYAEQFKDMLWDAFSLYGIKRFAEQVITIGGEFEKQKIALRSILGDATKAEVIYSQIKNLAVKSPFEFKDLTSYAKQLTAFSIPYNELFETTKRLADISAGLGVDMGRIILAYGQVRSAAVLRGQELRQFTEAGIPLVEEIANRFTEMEGKPITTGDVFERISKRMVSFEMVQDILFDLTEEGGKFFEMQEELAESLSGKWSNLKDAYGIMLSEIAEGNSGILKGSVEMITSMLNNWEKIASTLGGVATAFIAYKSALALANVYQAASILLSTKKINANIAEAASEAAKTGAITNGAAALLRYANNLKRVLTTMSAAGKVSLAIGAIAGVGAAVYGFTRKADELNRSLDETSSTISGKLSTDMKDFQRLVNTLGKTVEGTIEHQTILEQIKSKYGSFVGDIDNVSNAYEYLKGKVEDVTQAMKENARAQFESTNMNVATTSLNSVLDKKREEVFNAFNYLFQDEVISSQKQNQAIEKMRSLLTQGLDPNDPIFAQTLKNYLLELREDKVVNVQDVTHDLLDMARALVKFEGDTKRITETANALFGAKGSGDNEGLAKWGQSVEEFIKGYVGTDGIRTALKASIPQHEELLKDWATRILESYDEAKVELERQQKFKEKTPQFFDEKAMTSAKNQVDAYKLLIDEFNLDMFKEDKDNKSEDPVAEAWKQRINLLDEALDLYNKWLEIEGHEGAVKRVKNDVAFKDIFSNENLAGILENPESVWRYIQSQLGSTEAQRDLYGELDLKISGKSYDSAKVLADNFVEAFKKSIKDASERWDIYENLLSVGVDENIAATIAGGITSDSFKSQLTEQLKNALQGTGVSVEDALAGADVSKLKNSSIIKLLVEQINDENSKIKSETAKSLSEIIEKYRDYADQIREIERQKVEDIKKINESQLPQEEKNRIITEREKAAEKDIAKVNFEQFKDSSNWVKVFDDLDRVSTTTIDSMITQIEGFIAKGVEGEDILEQLVEALRKLRKESTERNPFKALSKSIKEYKKYANATDIGNEMSVVKDENGHASVVSNAEVAEKLHEAASELRIGLGEIAATYNQISSHILGIADLFGDVPEWVRDSISGIGDMLSGLENIDISKPMSVISGALQITKGALTTIISLGGLIPGFGGADYSSYNKLVEQYETLLTVWNELIDRKLEYIDISYGAEAVKVGKEAISIIEQEIDAYKQLGKERLNAGSSLGSHSIGVRQLKSISDEAWAQVQAASALAGFDYDALKEDRMVGLFDLSIEQLETLRDTAPLFWAKLDDDVRTYLEHIIEGNIKLEDAQDRIAEQLTQVSYDSMVDSFIDSLMDMEQSAEAFSDNFSEYLMRAILTAKIQELLGKDLEEFYAQYVKAMEDGNLTEDEVKNLQNFWMSITEAGMKIRDDMADITGYSDKYEKSGEGLSAGVKNITEDTANLLSSYINAMRQDLSVQRSAVVRFVDDLFPQYSILGQAQLQQLNMIQNNTKITADKITEMNSNFNAVINGTKKISVK